MVENNKGINSSSSSTNSSTNSSPSISTSSSSSSLTTFEIQQQQQHELNGLINNLSSNTNSIDLHITNEGASGSHNNNNNNNSNNTSVNINNSNINSNNNTPSSSPPKFNPKDRPISLPNQSAPIKHFALDIGGTLAKLVYFVQNKDKSNVNEIGGKLHFIKFRTKDIDLCLDFIIENNLHIEDGKPKDVRVTGGGAFKYSELFENRLGCKLIKEDEMQCLIWGTNFLLNNIKKESFTYSTTPNAISPKEFIDKTDDQYPFLLVNIGSGVSIIKVDSPTSFQRVDGTSLGGGTFFGLCSLLTGVTDYDEMLELTRNGESNTVDLVVGDIYGTDYSKIGLSSDTIASSFGKIIYKNPDGEKLDDIKKEDIAQSLLKMVSNNIGQIAYLNSQRYGLNKIYFGGFFIRDHPNTMQRISFAIDFWSKGKTKAMFLVHDGYLGALGAFLAPEPKEESESTCISEDSSVAESTSELVNKSWWKRTTNELSKLFSKSTSITTNSTTVNNNSTMTSSTTTTTTSTRISHDQNICECGCESSFDF
ncbi:hypothetical protein DICPUDRAFT_54979 [Dictyostelium purpureum]|uniref:pantothenate kinase n=1 Tax=Dictyostelium purpureum TaxID=5786 RepID=F0ZJR9_DICPU|nr:uncharacterized protein DICPUDRAFT_54979 [Dictyostelium purpureum]EGC35817.1 hypothetical protein DICPUDRAFT_54979 [Dictyostelium purpureum]|eukprot:XP_003287654.1 hypothetical protein DICPUDRAFT_54979 [Dictyostelium purpureum]